jgi:hypothetical protein
VTEGHAVRARSKDGTKSCQVLVRPTHVELGGADKTVALAEPLVDFLTKLLAHIGGLTSSPVGGALIVAPAAPAPQLPTIGSSKAKAGT